MPERKRTCDRERNPGQDADDKDDGELDMVMALTDKLKQSRLGKACARLKTDRKGGVYTLTAVMMPAVLGFSALGVDVSLWYLMRREIQTVADNAAIAGAYMAAAEATEQEILAAAVEDAGFNDFDVSASGKTIKVNKPPLNGAFAGDPGYVEVLVTSVAQSHFISAVLGEEVTVAARAVGGPTQAGEYCIVALDQTANDALNIAGTADVTAECGAVSNSSSSSAINIQGNATLTAGSAQAYGDISISGNASLTTDNPYHSLAQRVSDPLGPEGMDLQMPPSGSCDHNNMRAKNTVTLSPGRYCGGLTFQNANATLQPGTYIIDGGDLSSNGTSTITGDGVTFILTGDTSSDVGNVDFAGGTTSDLTAPSSGSYAGVLFFQDPNASTSGTNRVIGGSSMALDGIMYFPTREMLFTGGSGADAGCMMIVARIVSFQGNGYMSHDKERCEDLNISELTQFRIRLVE